MRRSNRNIETFDISLMAVVTKAMGAFLVLMLLLMPYYSSGPIGQQAAADLAKKVEQADLKIREVIDKLNKEINAGLADPGIRARFADLGSTVLPGSPSDFGKLIAEETEKWSKVIRAANLKAE